ncbi:hypothetical protein [Microbacterium sp.]|uniref:hypothetical protein n=1 Tax=Microbacterium sp. TaxID=51671 RepID=UPI001ACF6FC3|nr:hypothetical protein [Microbacterium sp.]MBN9156924.1 hypothetical protein [Microbacterium sp.]
MSEIVPLFGTHQTQSGQRVSGGLARRMRQEMEGVAASIEIAAVREQGQAFLAAQAMTNVATLVTQAEAHMKIAPGGAQFYEALITGYAIGAGQRIGRGF